MNIFFLDFLNDWTNIHKACFKMLYENVRTFLSEIVQFEIMSLWVYVRGLCTSLPLHKFHIGTKKPPQKTGIFSPSTNLHIYW